jgi:hypothetical protein
MAVRITLSGNANLEWSNPRWQRFLAFAFGVLALACFCELIASAADWTLLSILRRTHRLSTSDYETLYWVQRTFNDLWPIICGVALCLMARHERRHPDRWRVLRRMMLVVGITLLTVSLVHLVATRAVNVGPILWLRIYLWRILRPPWLGVVIAVLSCTVSHELARRGNSRLLSQLSQLPLWTVAAGTLLWFADLNLFTLRLGSIVWDWIFPTTVLAMSAVTIHVLLRGAREAIANWVSDP